jgi:pyruvate dehydrogenase E1 component beta subunit
VPLLSYLRAINRALGDEMERDSSVFVTGEDIRYALSNTTIGLFDRFGPDRVIETPASEQGMANFAIGAAMAGRRPVVEHQLPFLAMLCFERGPSWCCAARVQAGVPSTPTSRTPCSPTTE